MSDHGELKQSEESKPGSANKELLQTTSMNTMSILKDARWRDTRWTTSLRNCVGYVAAAIVRIRALAPYALIELVLPGGSVLAVLLWLYRRQKNGAKFGAFPGRLLWFLRRPIFLARKRWVPRASGWSGGDRFSLICYRLCEYRPLGAGLPR